MKILLVDDEPGNLRTLTGWLQAMGHRVVSADSSAAALEIMTALGNDPDRPSILLSDYRMPGINGLNLIRLIRQRNPKIAAILITAFKDAELQREAERIGVDAYLEKPFTPDQLQAVMDAVPATGTTPRGRSRDQ